MSKYKFVQEQFSVLYLSVHSLLVGRKFRHKTDRDTSTPESINIQKFANFLNTLLSGQDEYPAHLLVTQFVNLSWVIDKTLSKAVISYSGSVHNYPQLSPDKQTAWQRLCQILRNTKGIQAITLRVVRPTTPLARKDGLPRAARPLFQRLACA